MRRSYRREKEEEMESEMRRKEVRRDFVGDADEIVRIVSEAELLVGGRGVGGVEEDEVGEGEVALDVFEAGDDLDEALRGLVVPL